MKDYYDILGVARNADADQIKSAFRKLAFEHHPDRNPGDEIGASERFKQINEAYSILSDDLKRRRYDAMLAGRFAGVGGSGDYQEDIFSQSFSGQDIFSELQCMFAQMGLRFDEEFVNKTFKGGNGGAHFQFFSGAGQPFRSYGRQGSPYCSNSQRVAKEPNFFQRQINKVNRKIGRFLIKRAFGVDIDNPFADERKYKRPR